MREILVSLLSSQSKKWTVCFYDWRFRAGSEAAEQRDVLPGPLHRRDTLIQKRKLVEVKKVNRNYSGPRGWHTCLVKESIRSVSCAGGDRGAAAEVGGADGPQPVSAAADPARGASSGGPGAGKFGTAELHRSSASRPKPDPAGPGQL